ncbi:hypothetical protein [Runella rosea]|uniref:hypothetical protein n=1 Tax=Runella rosea TaxID=2259595 RepID=UPI0013B41F58|nr:hypothetical protein [Runella rosea]
MKTLTYRLIGTAYPIEGQLFGSAATAARVYQIARVHGARLVSYCLTHSRPC